MSDNSTIGDRTAHPGGLQRALAVLKFIGVKTFVEPIVEGRLRDDRRPPWPRGLRAIVAVGIVMYAMLTAVAVFAKPLRQLALMVMPDGLSMPRLIVPLLMVGIAFILAAVYTGVLHMVWWVRFPAVIAICVVAVGPIRSDDLVALAIQAFGLLSLLVFTLVRGRKPFSSGEFVVALVILGHIFISGFIRSSAMSVMSDQVAMATLQSTLLKLTMYAAPALLLTGAAMLELTVTVSTWTARGVWEGIMASRHRVVVGAVLMGILLVITWSVEVGRLIQGGEGYTLPDIGRGLIYLVVAIVLALLVLRAAPQSHRAGVTVDGDDIAAGWSATSVGLAIALALSMFGSSLLGDFASLFGLATPSLLGDVLAVVTGLILIRIGVQQARANKVARALMSTMLGMSLGIGKLSLLLSWGISVDSVWFCTVLVATVVLIWLVVRQRLTPDRGLALATVFVVSRAYDLRKYLDNPFTELSALSGTSMALLVGLLWRQLTEYQYTRGGSARFPMPSRVLVAIGNMSLVGLAIAAGALSLGQGVIGIDQMEDIGSSELGGALLTAVLVASLLIAWLGREGGDAAPGAEYRVLPMTLIEEKGWEPGFFDQHAPRW